MSKFLAAALLIAPPATTLASPTPKSLLVVLSTVDTVKDKAALEKKMAAAIVASITRLGDLNPAHVAAIPELQGKPIDACVQECAATLAARLETHTVVVYRFSRVASGWATSVRLILLSAQPMEHRLTAEVSNGEAALLQSVEALTRGVFAKAGVTAPGTTAGTANAPTRLMLAASSGFGELHIVSPNVYGRIFVNGEDKGFPPLVVKRVRRGVAFIEVKVDGRVRRAKNVVVGEERSRVVFR